MYRRRKETLVRKRDESTLLGNHLSHWREKDGKQKGDDIMNLHPAKIATVSETRQKL